jgi:hypothetical protein
MPLKFEGDPRVAAAAIAVNEQRIAAFKDWLRAVEADEVRNLLRLMDRYARRGKTKEHRIMGSLAGAMVLLLAAQLREENDETDG